MLRRITSLVVAILMIVTITITGATTVNASDGENSQNGILITGDSVEKDIKISYEDLEKMPLVKYSYSTSNNFPTNKIIYAEGILLESILSKVNLKSSITTIKVTSVDGYSKTFTAQELLKDDRYYYPNINKGSTEGLQLTKPIIALKTGEKGFGQLEKADPVLMMGQRSVNEQNNPWFVKSVAKIEISAKPIEKWSAPVADPASGEVTNGKEIKLLHKQLDSLKIYYTLDGTDPTINSSMYNKSASYYQPELNLPIKIEKNTTLKVIAIGAGKPNSDIVTYQYTVNSATNNQNNTSFNDLQGYEWAENAIGFLAEKKIINGIGNGQFNPRGYLTRAEFSKIMVLALNKEPVPYKNSFTDVSSKDWYCGYVEKAVQLGILQGVGDGKFNPKDQVTKEQMIAIIVRAIGKESEAKALDNNANKVFDSSSNISIWAKGYVEIAETLGLLEHGHIVVDMNGKPTIDGKSFTSRGESAVTVEKMLKFL